MTFCMRIILFGCFILLTTFGFVLHFSFLSQTVFSLFFSPLKKSWSAPKYNTLLHNSLTSDIFLNYAYSVTQRGEANATWTSSCFKDHFRFKNLKKK